MPQGNLHVLDAQSGRGLVWPFPPINSYECQERSRSTDQADCTGMGATLSMPIAPQEALRPPRRCQIKALATGSAAHHIVEGGGGLGTIHPVTKLERFYLTPLNLPIQLRSEWMFCGDAPASDPTYFEFQ